MQPFRAVLSREFCEIVHNILDTSLNVRIISHRPSESHQKTFKLGWIFLNLGASAVAELFYFVFLALSARTTPPPDPESPILTVLVSFALPPLDLPEPAIKHLPRRLYVVGGALSFMTLVLASDCLL